MLCNSKLNIVIMISYIFQFSVISVLRSKEYIISVNININNLTVNFKDDIVVKFNFKNDIVGWIESTFYVYLPIILHQLVTMVTLARLTFQPYLKRQSLWSLIDEDVTGPWLLLPDAAHIAWTIPYCVYN